MSEQPYLESVSWVVSKRYNPAYGDERTCVCGHDAYYRHFDTYDEMRVAGCKYCGCSEFVEAKVEMTKAQRDVLDTARSYALLRSMLETAIPITVWRATVPHVVEVKDGKPVVEQITTYLVRSAMEGGIPGEMRAEVECSFLAGQPVTT